MTETIFIEIETPVGKNIIVGVIYRPPNNIIEVFENAMNGILDKIDKENKIMGDFNIDLLNQSLVIMLIDSQNSFSHHRIFHL